jgi:hypothetical protein
MRESLKKFVTVSFSLILLFLFFACKKDISGNGDNNNNPGGGYPVITDSNYNPSDPQTAATIGFFGNSWQAKTFAAPGTTDGAVATGTVTDSLTIDVNKVLVKVSPMVYGNNSNLWSGQITTQPDLMKYITDLSPNIIRAPAGSVSDVYFWNGTDAAHAPSDAPASLVNADGSTSAAGYWYGGNTASWTFSLDNYYNLLSQTNSTGIFTINYGYARYGTGADPVAAAAHLAADLVRHDNGRIKYWEIGNENFGNWEAGYRIDVSQNKDGQPEFVTGALYGQHFKVFADSMKMAAHQVGAIIYIGAILYEQPTTSSDPASEQTWNQGVFEKAGNVPDFYVVHDYFTPYNANTSAADILATATAETARAIDYVKQQISAAGVGIKPIAMTEWNIRATGSKQNTSFIAGMHVAKTLGALIKNGFGEASRWDLSNGYDNGDDMGLFNVGDEPNAPKWNPRPAYFYQYYFYKFFGDRMVYDTLRASNSDISTFSSTFSSGQAGTLIINSGTLSHIVSVDFQHFPAGSKYYWYVLTGGTDNGDFSGQVLVNGTGPTTPTGGPLNYEDIKAYSAPLSGTIKVSVPPRSVIYLVADKK